MHDPTRFSLQAALMAMSAWVLGSLLLSLSFWLVGLGGIVVLLGTLVVARIAVRVLAHPDDDDLG